MDPSVWGPAGWRVLHRMAYRFARRDDAAAFYASLQSLLPCPTCRANLKQHMAALPFPKAMAGVSRWVYDVHHRVNGTKHAPSEPTYAEVRRQYQHASFDEMEWIFVDAMVKMHPGKWKADEAYLQNLRTFLGCWTQESGLEMPEDISSKSKLQSWVAKHTKSKGCRKVCAVTCARPV